MNMKIPNLTQDPTGKTWLLQSALRVLGYDIAVDNWRGPRTERALTDFMTRLESDDGGWQSVKASSFADIKDVAAFQRCKERGGSDMQCFAVGDNGIGAWGHKTAQTHTPMVALPREIWKRAGKSGGAKVQVHYLGRVAEAILGDTMPSLANIRNGAGIDLNPACSLALGQTPPHMLEGVRWRWVL